MKGAFLVVVLACLAPPVGGGTEDSRPSFPSAASLVAVDVSVLDSQGRQLPNLGPEDFGLSVDGRTRKILSADFRSYERTHTEAASEHFSSNEGVAPGRLLVLVVDQGNISVGGGRAVFQATDRLLSHLNPADRTALVTIPRGSGAQVDFTAQPAKIRQALQGIVGSARFTGQRVSVGEALVYSRDPEGQEWQQVIDRECAFLRSFSRQNCVSQVEGDAGSLASIVKAHGNQTLQSLRGLMEALKGIGGTKTMLLLSGGLLVEEHSDIQELAAVAAAARVRLFVLLLDGAGGDASVGRMFRSGDDSRTFASGLQELAGLARGTVFRVASTGAEAFDRIANELAGDYLLGFAPEESERDGKFHELRVEVRRPGVTVRSRRSVIFPVPPANPPKGEDILAQALRVPAVLTELPVRVATYTVREPGTAKVRLLVSAEIGRRGGPQPGTALVGFVVRDDAGKIVAGGLDNASAADRAGPLSFVGATVVAPGTYTLRLAARDDVGRLGSVEHTAQAALTSASRLELSDLILQSQGAESALRPEVDVEVAGAEALAYLEVYSTDPKILAQAGVTFEIAVLEGDPALVTLPMSLVASREPDRRIAQGPLRLDGLDAGDYVARAVVSVAGHEVRRISAPFRLAAPNDPAVRP